MVDVKFLVTDGGDFISDNEIQDLFSLFKNNRSEN